MEGVSARVCRLRTGKKQDIEDTSTIVAWFAGHVASLGDDPYQEDFLRGQNGGPRCVINTDNLRGPLQVQLVSLDTLYVLQQQVCPQTPFEPQLTNDMVQLLNECIGCWMMGLISAVSTNSSSSAWLEAVLPRRDPTDGKTTLDSILYQQGIQGQASTGVVFCHSAST